MSGKTKLSRVFKKLQEHQLTFAKIMVMAGINQDDMGFGSGTFESFQEFVEDGPFEHHIKRMFPDIPRALGDEILGDNEYCAGILNWLIENEKFGFIIQVDRIYPQFNQTFWFYGDTLTDIVEQSIEWRNEIDKIWLSTKKTKKKGR